MVIKNNPKKYVTVGMVQDLRRKEWLARCVPTAIDALQAIADLPTAKNEDVMAGQEDAYRAVERLFSAPPVIHAKANT